MVASDSFAEFLREQLAPLGRITMRRMFGKTGVFCDGVMLGMVTDNTLYLRVDDHHRAIFEEAGSFPPLNYEKQGRTIDLSFWRASERLFDESDELVDWARAALVAARRVAAKRARMAPVSGGTAGAEAASLTFMVGGEAAVFARAQPLLAAMGRTIVHAGPAGNGQAAKICNNMILGVSMIAVCEAFALAERLGLEAQTLFEISSKSSGQCWALTSYCPVPGPVPGSPANRGYAPGFTAAMMLKDLRLAQQAAGATATATPLGAAAANLYQLSVDAGADSLDFSSIFRLIHKPQGKI
ncbi:MAG: NAD-binding protein [Alphaproteobacteria bacterium]|nr:NAD-binding protein [Alphaproteobacteria bacterium]